MAGKLPKIGVFWVKPGCSSIETLFMTTKQGSLEIPHRCDDQKPSNLFRACQISLVNVRPQPTRLTKLRIL